MESLAPILFQATYVKLIKTNHVSYHLATNTTLTSISLNSNAYPRKYLKEELSASWVNMVCEANGFVEIIINCNLTNQYHLKPHITAE